MKRNFKLIFTAFVAFLIFNPAFSQNTKISYSGSRGYTLVERTNLRRYENGKYTGLTSREVRSFISTGRSLISVKKNPVAAKAQWYDGNFFVMEETLRNSKTAAAGVHDSIPSVFYIDSDGQMTMFQDNGYPSFRSFPSYTTQNIAPGDSWKAKAERAVDPLNKGIFTRIPILVLYTFSGEENYKGEEVYRIKAMWQTNYGFSNYDRDPKGDSTLQKATGGHKADIIVRKATGEAILIIDNVDETFAYSDGHQINFKGTITLFTEYPPAVDHNKLLMFLNRVATVKADPVPASSEKLPGSFASSKTSGTSASSGGASSGELSEKASASVAKKDTAKVSVSDSGSGSGAVLGLNESPKNNLLVEKTQAGLRLSIRDIKFKPDSAQVVSSESERLDQIADALKLAPENQFLIEGHTASVGKPAGEQQLSMERARAIAKELSSRGIPAEKFICRGWGGNKPVADNSTDAGRAQNRRVEITILE